MNPVEVNIDRIINLCNIYHVDKMYIFGSALTEDFNSESDIDFLVKFKPFELSQYLENYMNFKENLESLLGREVDLLEEQTLRNPIFIRSINKSKKLVYGFTKIKR